jgi:hypothetical protein
MQTPLEPDAFFNQYVPAVRSIPDQFYCNCRDRTDYHRCAVGFMRQYFSERSSSEPAATDLRQHSWDSSTSTTVDWVQQHVPPQSSVKPVFGDSAAKVASHQQTRRSHRTASKWRSRPTRRETRKEVCPHCRYAATGTDRLKLLRRHMKTHNDTEELFECGFPSLDGSVCSKRYNRPDNLRSHQRKELHTHGGRERRLLRKRLPGGPKYRPDID